MWQRRVRVMADLKRKLAHDDFNPVPYRQLFYNNLLYLFVFAMVGWNCVSDLIYNSIGLHLALYLIDFLVNALVFLMALRLSVKKEKSYLVVYAGFNLIFACLISFASNLGVLLFIMFLDSLTNICLIFVRYRDSNHSDFVPLLPRLLGTYTKTTTNINTPLSASTSEAIPLAQVQEEVRAASKKRELRAQEQSISTNRTAESDTDPNSLSHLLDLE